MFILTGWRFRKRVLSTAMKNNKQGTFLDGILPQALPWYVARRVPPKELRQRWSELMGEYLSARAVPVCLEPDGLLVLAVKGSALRQELTMSAGQVVARLSQAGFNVSGLKIITARIGRQVEAKRAAMPQLSGQEEAQVAAMVKDVASLQVRQALQHMLLAHMRAVKAEG